jgi:hypothetical protein
VVQGGQEEEFDWQREQRRLEKLEGEKKLNEDELERDRRAEEEWRNVVHGEQEEDDSMYYMEDEKQRALVEEDYWKEVKVSSELGDYDLLQYRCGEELETELDDFVEDEQEEDEHSRLLRFAALEMVEPQPMPNDRGEILKALLASNGGKLLRSQARKKMHLSESSFSELLATMGGYIEVRPYHRNKNQKVLVLK